MEISKEIIETSKLPWFPEMMRELGYEPVKHGYWIAHAMSIKDVPTEACSECGEWSYGCDEPYCPKCGAKMDEQET